MMNHKKRITLRCLGQCKRIVTRQARLSVLLPTALILSCSAAHAQLTTADILGTVSDSSGAVVPNASVTLRNLETNDAHMMQSNGSGDYNFTLLPAGHYSASVKANGFQAWVTRDLAVEVDGG
jgi:hypothetical protein